MKSTPNRKRTSGCMVPPVFFYQKRSYGSTLHMSTFAMKDLKGLVLCCK